MVPCFDKSTLNIASACDANENLTKIYNLGISGRNDIAYSTEKIHVRVRLFGRHEYTRFFIRKILCESKLKKPHNLQKMLRKSPASNT